ncbi:MAG: formate dehydrogenase accessory sulfurtransferase FdhD [Xanthobacteraceae bacterium]|nr:MAG: formate dehydrogenase accessory sulfurtransferase FdhD [Xanthobacteraceae bacterium]
MKSSATEVEAQAEAVRRVACVVYRGTEAIAQTRVVPEEVPVALSYNGTTHAVMMATPADLTDFAIGFSLTEGVIDAAADVESFEVVTQEAGIELRMWLAPGRAVDFAARRRRLAGPTGCGLCGIESLEQALPAVAPVGPGITAEAQTIRAAVASLTSTQAIHRATSAVHAAGFFMPGAGLIAVREDVGRHNALDKLIGHLARRGIDGAGGIVVLTSRVSVEMVQKAATLGATIVVAISAPTALAIRVADQAGITLVAVARPDSFEVFTHEARIRPA